MAVRSELLICVALLLTSAATASRDFHNREAPIPSQCYTRTESHFNPCYTCHQSYPADARHTNQQRDGFQQGSYAFSDIGVTNHWTNLFVDRTEAIERISNRAIDRYVAQDNYAAFQADAPRQPWVLDNLAAGPDAFDAGGLARDGSRWVAFNYKPLPSTFWPTNGSAGDVMIRLPAKYSTLEGKFSRDVYFANLALLELAILDLEATSVTAIDEQRVGVDLDGDGSIGVTKLVKRQPNWVGDAAHEPIPHMLYPQGTEFLHTVRYLTPKGTGAARMKEVRYMYKQAFLPLARLKSVYYAEAKEKHYGELPVLIDRGEHGVSNRMGWILHGFIEDERGYLRRQTSEEMFFCTGCHKAVGTTIDNSFAFPRKIPGALGWRYIDLEAMADLPNRGETRGEYETYLERVGGGDEFRQNREMLQRWFRADGTVDIAKVGRLTSIAELIQPSPKRARLLNKAYLAIVHEQSFVKGRDTTISPATNVFESIDREVPPLPPDRHFHWDIRLEADPF